MEHLRIEDLKEFLSEIRIRKKLLITEKLAAEVVCYDSDKAFHNTRAQKKMRFFAPSRGEIGLWSPLEPTSLIAVPAQGSHGIRATRDSRLVFMFVKAPGFTSSS